MEHHCQVLILENDQTDLWTLSVSLKTTSLRLFLSDLLQNDCNSISARSSSQHLAFNGNAWRGCHELWQSCSKTAIRLNNACWLTWFVLKLFMLSPSTGLHWYRWGVGGEDGVGWIFDSGTSGRKDLRNCCDNTVTWQSFSEVVNGTKKKVKLRRGAFLNMFAWSDQQ